MFGGQRTAGRTQVSGQEMLAKITPQGWQSTK